MKAYKFFSIRELPKPRGRKTGIYELVNARSGGVIGTISWYAPWRQFCFFPAGDTAWSVGCLRDVNEFIGSLKGGGG